MPQTLRQNANNILVTQIVPSFVNQLHTCVLMVSSYTGRLCRPSGSTRAAQLGVSRTSTPALETQDTTINKYHQSVLLELRAALPGERDGLIPS